MAIFKKQYTITPSYVDEAILLFKKYENGVVVESYGILIDEIGSIRRQAEMNGYDYAVNIDFIKHEISVHQECIDALQKRVDEAIASGNYVEEA